MQRDLNVYGYGLQVDGWYGRVVEMVVRQFRHVVGLPASDVHDGGVADERVQRLARRPPAQLADRLGAGYLETGNDYTDGHDWRRIHIAAIAVEQAFATTCPLAAAATMLQLESSGGRNVWGHDDSPCDDLPYVKGDPVTDQAYRAYLARRDECGAQGVGPCQLTWPPYQDEADRLGGCWRPEINCRVGFGLLASHIRKHGPRDAFSIYNTGRPGVTAYAAKAMTIMPRWQAVIEGTVSR